MKHHPVLPHLGTDLHTCQTHGEDAQMLDDFFRSHPNVKNGITFNSKSYIIGEYLQKSRKERFQSDGIRPSETECPCLMEGSIFFLIAQQPILQRPTESSGLSDYLILKRNPRELYAD